MGFNYTSFDLNGKDGSLKVDLSKEIKSEKYKNAFDIVTNSGTSEHVKPFASQYECFKNVHFCCKAGGIFIHMVPKVGTFHNHSHYYYDKRFFKKLSKLNRYKIIFLKTLTYTLNPNRFLVAACMRKMDNENFCVNKDEILSYIHSRKCNR